MLKIRICPFVEIKHVQFAVDQLEDDDDLVVEELVEDPPGGGHLEVGRPVAPLLDHWPLNLEYF